MPVHRPPSDTDRARAAGRLAAAVAAREVVERLARAFAPTALPVAPLKAALLIHAWGRDPLDRPLSDVDLLVPPDRLDEATTLAQQAGWRFVKEERGGRQRLLLPATKGLAVDLHGGLFPQGVFRLETKAVLERATVDTSLFGAPVRLLAPMDAFLHLVGHAALTFLFEHRVHHPADLPFLARRHALRPQAVAMALEEARMTTAARYALSLGEGADFNRQVLRALSPHLPSQALAWLVTRGVPLLPARRGLGLVPPLVLHREPVLAARQLLDAAWRRAGR